MCPTGPFGPAAHKAVIELQFCYYQQLAGSPVLADYWHMLEPLERARHNRLRRASDRLCYLVTRALVRTALSELAAVQPKQWQFRPTPHGKPTVAYPVALPVGLDFSVSHADKLIVLALHRHGAVGVDAESLGERTIPLQVCPLLLTSDEQHTFDRLPRHAQQQRFFQYWTLKEAHVKALGIGLSHPLTSFSFRFTSPSGLHFINQDQDAQAWDFWHFGMDLHSVAVCAKTQGLPSVLRAKVVHPLLSSTALVLHAAWSTTNDNNGVETRAKALS